MSTDQNESSGIGHRSDCDRGFNLLEVVIVTSLIGLITTVLAGAIVVSLRSIPDTETRLDDARSTRALSTWLSHDTTSAPGFLPLQSQGGIDISTSENPDLCGSGDGKNLLHLQWTESAFADTTYVANYRFVVEDGQGEIRRYTCSAAGAGPFSATGVQLLTSGLDPSKPPVVVPTPASGDVTSLTFELAGKSGETVAIETGSRNPADFFPS